MKKIITILILGLSVSLFASEFSSNTIHIGVVVSDLEKSIDFYKNVIGMSQPGDPLEFNLDEKFSHDSGLANGETVHIDVLKLDDAKEATHFKLMSFGKKAKKQKNSFIYNHTGMQYITIYVKDLKPFMERIKKHRVKLLGKTPVMLGDGPDHFVLVQDPDGTFIELIGPMLK